MSSDDSDGAAIAKWLQQQHASKVAVLAANEQSTVSTAGRAVASLQADHIQVVGPIKYASGQSSYSSIVQNVLSSGASYVALAGGQSDGSTIVKELRAASYTGHIITSSDMAVTSVLSAIGASNSGNLVAESATSTTSTPAYRYFAAAYKAQYGSAPAVGVFIAHSYDAAMIGILAAVAANSTSGAAINQKIRTVADPPGTSVYDVKQALTLLRKGTDIDYVGASGPVNFNSSGTVQGAYAIVAPKSGQWVTSEVFPPSSFKQ